jgi:phage terminase Nu1 subunit (DNA packaging protein)
MSTASYPVSTIAKLFEITERRVQQLAKDGVIPKAEKGKYELIGSVKGYIKYLQERAYGKEVTHADAHLDKARLTKIQADIAEIDLQKLRGKLVAIEDVEHEWSNLVTAFRSRILAIPNKAAHSVIGVKEHHKIENKIRDMINEALTELSKYESINDGERNSKSEAGSFSDINIGEENSETDSTTTESESK